MRPLVRLGIYALGLLAVFAAASGVGLAVGPVVDSEKTSSQADSSGESGGAAEAMPGHGADETDDAEDGAGHGKGAGRDEAAGHDEADKTGEGAGHGGGAGHGEGARHGAGAVAPAALPGGLMVAQDGYRFVPAATTFRPGVGQEFAFWILGPRGVPVTAYERTHDKQMHLIVVRRDLSGFQHVHPRLARDGTWRVPLEFARAGQYRAFADFLPSGADEALKLGVDLSVSGDYQPRPLPPQRDSFEVDGYTVTLHGTLTPGRQSKLTLSVSRNGQPVRDLQPYLAAYGHLVALRDGDLAYLHVHPDGEPGDGRTKPGPDITFYATAPSAGDYRLYLDFRHRDQVRTAEFTVRSGR